MSLLSEPYVFSPQLPLVAESKYAAFKKQNKKPLNKNRLGLPSPKTAYVLFNSASEQLVYET